MVHDNPLTSSDSDIKHQQFHDTMNLRFSSEQEPNPHIDLKKEIAAILEISEEQVKINIYRARQVIKQKYIEAEKYGL